MSKMIVNVNESGNAVNNSLVLNGVVLGKAKSKTIDGSDGVTYYQNLYAVDCTNPNNGLSARVMAERWESIYGSDELRDALKEGDKVSVLSEPYVGNDGVMRSKFTIIGGDSFDISGDTEIAAMVGMELTKVVKNPTKGNLTKARNKLAKANKEARVASLRNRGIIL